MQSDQLIAAADTLVAAARRHGADGADAVARHAESQSVTVRLGKLEDIDRSESIEVGLRTFVGRRSASVSTSDLSRAGLEALAERAVAMARHAPEDPFAGLAPGDSLARGPWADLDLADPSDTAAGALRERAHEAEAAALAVSGVRNSEGGSASASRGTHALVTSNGFAGAYTGTTHGLSAGVIAGEGEGMQRDYAMRSARHCADLPTPAEIGRLAGERAVGRLAPAVPPTGAMPVVFRPRVSASLLGHLLGAMAAPSLARRASFLIGHEDEPIVPSNITIIEDAARPRGVRSRPFDGEGIACLPRELVTGGKIACWPSNVAASAQLGLPLTGHAARGGGGAPGISHSNVDLLAGSETLDELIADIADGVLVDYLIGQGFNPVTGDYSRGAAGRRIVKGRIEGPVAGFTIAGNLRAMLATVRVADDLETWRAVNAPSLRIEGMTVAAA